MLALPLSKYDTVPQEPLYPRVAPASCHTLLVRFAQDIPLKVPKKTRLYVEQTARERDQVNFVWVLVPHC